MNNALALADLGFLIICASSRISCSGFSLRIKSTNPEWVAVSLKVAYDMLLQVASILEADAKTLIESLPLLDDEAIAVFMEYYAEYIVDTHLIDILLEIPEDEEEEWEEVPLEDVLDEAYRTIKEIFCSEVKTDERSEDNRHM